MAARPVRLAASPSARRPGPSQFAEPPRPCIQRVLGCRALAMPALVGGMRARRRAGPRCARAPPFSVHFVAPQGAHTAAATVPCRPAPA
eukprot:scaffold43228_cov264-Isochrysis_galbana.AAC.1